MNRLSSCIVLCGVSLVLGGCMTPKQTFLPDGSKGYSINCSGTLNNWNICYEQAGKTCGAKGYEILNKEGDEGTTVSGTQYGVFGGTMINRTLLVRCNT